MEPDHLTVGERLLELRVIQAEPLAEEMAMEKRGEVEVEGEMEEGEGEEGEVEIEVKKKPSPDALFRSRMR